MHAYYLDAPDSPLGATALAAEGILHWALPVEPAAYEAPLAALREARGYVQMDEVVLGPATPNLDALLTKFFSEHLHTDEEIRFVVEGGGIFDLRDGGDRWLRVHVGPGDLIIVPAHKYHRFALDELGTIRCKRLFQDDKGWTPVMR